MLIDNAKYHHAILHKEWRKKMEAKGFFLKYLPPYSPDLNPIERIWKLTRRLKLHNRFFSNIDEIINALDTLFKEWSVPNNQLKQLCAFT